MATTKKRVRLDIMEEMFHISDAELPLKTNTPLSKMESFILMDTVEQGLSLRGVKKDGSFGNRPLLSQIYRRAHDRRMISLRGQGAKYAWAALAAKDQADGMPEFRMGSY